MRHRDVVIFLLCTIPRLAALFWFPPDTSVFFYWSASEEVLSRGAPVLDGLLDTSTEPAYPALLAVLRAVSGDRIRLVFLAQVALAAAGGVLLYRLTDGLAGPRAALVTAALYAFDPYLVRQAVSPVEITLCTTLLITATWTYSRGRSAAAAGATGLIVALAALTRFSLLPVALGTFGLYFWRRRWREAAAFALAVALSVGGWMLRTYSLNGALVPTRVGINLFVSTSEYADQVVPLRNADLLVPWAYETIGRELQGAPPDPLEYQRVQDAALLARALAYMREHPLETARLKLRNLACTLAPVLLPLERKTRHAGAAIIDGRVRVGGLEPRPLVEHVLYSGSRLLLLAGAAAGLMRRRGRWHRGDGMLLVVAAAVILVNTAFFPTSRLLAPMAFVLMFYTGAAVEGRSGVRSCFLHE